jgi:HEAT repeat protein
MVALALGEWGDGRAVEPLARVLVGDPEELVRLYALAALRQLGGPTALEALARAAEEGPEGVRTAAVAAIEDLATGGRRDDSEPPEMDSRTRGAIRTRGNPARGTGRTELLDRVADTLERVRGDAAAGEYLRRRAADVLGYLRG